MRRPLVTTAVSGILFAISPWIATAAPVHDQRNLSAEVRVTASSERGESSVDIGPKLWNVQGMTLREVLSELYGIQPSRIDVSAFRTTPVRLDERFDISLPLRGSETDEQVRAALERALATQLDIQLSFDTRTVDSYVLTAPSGAGAKLVRASLKNTRPSEFDAGRITVSGQICPGFTTTELWGHAATVSGLAGALEGGLDLPVTDETGLAGVYDFHIPEYRTTAELISLLDRELGIVVKRAPREVQVLTVRPASAAYQLRQAM